jgi:hypothetical protein
MPLAQKKAAFSRGEGRAMCEYLEISNISSNLIGRTSPTDESRALDAPGYDDQVFLPARRVHGSKLLDAVSWVKLPVEA